MTEAIVSGVEASFSKIDSPVSRSATAIETPPFFAGERSAACSRAAFSEEGCVTVFLLVEPLRDELFGAAKEPGGASRKAARKTATRLCQRAALVTLKL